MDDLSLVNAVSRLLIRCKIITTPPSGKAYANVMSRPRKSTPNSLSVVPTLELLKDSPLVVFVGEEVADLPALTTQLLPPSHLLA